MRKKEDKISNRILDIINSSDEPLETVEIEDSLKDVSRVMILYRLHQLRGDGVMKGKPVGSGKGTWIWWKPRLAKK